MIKDNITSRAVIIQYVLDSNTIESVYVGTIDSHGLPDT